MDGPSAALGQRSSLDVDFIVRCRHCCCHLLRCRCVLDAASRRYLNLGQKDGAEMFNSNSSAEIPEIETIAKPFDFDAAADLFPAKGRKFRRQFVSYKRYVRAADAIRFAIEELPAESLLGTYLEVGEARLDSRAIRELYDSIDYPLVRRAAS